MLCFSHQLYFFNSDLKATLLGSFCLVGYQHTDIFENRSQNMLGGGGGCSWWEGISVYKLSLEVSPVCALKSSLLEVYF